MPIRRYLDAHTFDPETIRLLGLAFEITRSALNVQEGDERAKEIIAAKLIELAKQGERDRLSERALSTICGVPSSADGTVIHRAD